LAEDAKRGLSPDEHARIVALLEGRRAALAAEQWQPPALALAGQAFLLQALANPDLDWWAALPIMLAGVLASVTVWVSLAQQRDRELTHGEEVDRRMKEHLDWPDLRRYKLPSAPKERRAFGLRWRVPLRAHPQEWGTRKMWMATMFLFGAADVAVFITTHCQ
jgi:hypothetical protein